MAEDPRCPECGEPIGQTATYCMHCSADLTREHETADDDEDGVWDTVEASAESAEGGAGGTAGSASGGGVDGGAGGRGASGTGTESVDPPSFDAAAGAGELLDSDGFVDDSLTILVGIAGGIVIGLVGTIVLAVVTGSLWAIAFGVLAWLVATAHLARRRTVQGAISRGAYGVSLVLLLVPAVALSPLMDAGLEERGGALLALLMAIIVPAGIAAAIGWIASRFVPDGAAEGTG